VCAAKHYLQKQHPTCHRAWKVYVDQNLDSEYELDGFDDGLPVHVLLRELEIIARRNALNFSLELEMDIRIMILLKTRC